MKIRLPAEWEEQSGVMLTWPHSVNAWKGHLTAANQTLTQITVELSHREIVLIVCQDKAHQAHIYQLLEKSAATQANLRFVIAPSNDIWARDHAPLSIENLTSDHSFMSLIDFTFNGWGNKYPAEQDNQITSELNKAGVFCTTQIQSNAFILEGGSIETDGNGTLLSTTSCLLNPNRNPGLTQQAIELQLKHQLGIERFLWLNHGQLAGDDTDGHIDTLARFCDANTIAYTSCDDVNDEHFESLQQMANELASFKTAENKTYRLVPLPIPRAIYDDRGERLPANYSNFLIINDAVLVPIYNDKHDELALESLQACFPGREIIGIDCCSLVQQFGSLHCATMQFPHGILQ